jgi:hypothetical protein
MGARRAHACAVRALEPVSTGACMVHCLVLICTTLYSTPSVFFLSNITLTRYRGAAPLHTQVISGHQCLKAAQIDHIGWCDVEGGYSEQRQ